MKRALPLGALLMLVACGASFGVDSSHAAGKTLPTPSARSVPMVVHPAAIARPFFTHLHMDSPVGQANQCDGTGGQPPTLAQLLQRVGSAPGERAAAIVTVDSVGPAEWNTPDGHRWTQAEIDAGTSVYPAIFTPYVLTVQRPLGGVSAGQQITAYLPGGTTPQGDVSNACYVPRVVPQPGWSAVVILGSEIDSAVASNTAPLHKPSITEFDVIKNGAAQTTSGPQPIPHD
jgi:hypothetical protein